MEISEWVMDNVYRFNPRRETVNPDNANNSICSDVEAANSKINRQNSHWTE